MFKNVVLKLNGQSYTEHLFANSTFSDLVMSERYFMMGTYLLQYDMHITLTLSE